MAHPLPQSNIDISVASHGTLRRSTRLSQPPQRYIPSFSNTNSSRRARRATPAVFPPARTASRAARIHRRSNHTSSSSISWSNSGSSNSSSSSNNNNNNEQQYYILIELINDLVQNQRVNNLFGWGEEERSDHDHHHHHDDGLDGLSEEKMGRCLKKRKVICEDDYVDKVCALCLDDLFGDGDDVATIVGFLDNCGHEFHVGCVKKWLIKKNSCPLCRATAFTAP